MKLIRWLFIVTAAGILILVGQTSHVTTATQVESVTIPTTFHVTAYSAYGAGGVESISLFGDALDASYPFQWEPNRIQPDSREIGWPVTCAREGFRVYASTHGDGGMVLFCIPFGAKVREL